MDIFKDGDTNGESDDDMAVAALICGGILPRQKQKEKPDFGGSRPGRSSNINRDFRTAYCNLQQDYFRPFRDTRRLLSNDDFACLGMYLTESTTPLKERVYLFSVSMH